MKKLLSILVVVVMMLTVTFVFTGCGNTNNEGNNDNTSGKSWPTDISYVPNIAYDGKGKIVDTKEDTAMGGTQYMIYIDGATLQSANEYIDKLYSNNWKKLHMFREAGEHLEQPESGKYQKLGFENEDETINAMVTFYSDNDRGSKKYNLAIVFGDTSDN